jgi:hypothetical protein
VKLLAKLVCMIARILARCVTRLSHTCFTFLSVVDRFGWSNGLFARGQRKTGHFRGIIAHKKKHTNFQQAN